MFRLLRLFLLAAAFLGGCQAQNWLSINRCLDRGGQWAPSGGELPGGVCVGLKAK
jgi:hypothetical protein